MDKIAYWDAIAKEWESTLSQHILRDYSDAIYNQLFASWIPNPRVRFLLKTDLFDEAFGKGVLSSLRDHAAHIIGIDIAGSILCKVQNKEIPIDVMQSDVRFMPFANDSFDIVVSNSTLDHFESGSQIVLSLKEFYRILRPNGLLLLTMDNLANPVIMLRQILPFRLLYRLKIIPYYVGKTWGPVRLVRVLKQLKFKAIDIKTVMHVPRIIIPFIVKFLGKYLSSEREKYFIEKLLYIEYFSKWPSRYLTGHFIAVKAIKHES